MKEDGPPEKTPSKPNTSSSKQGKSYTTPIANPEPKFSPSPSKKTNFESVLKKHGFEFQSMFGDVKHVRDATQLPVPPKTNDFFQTPQKAASRSAEIEMVLVHDINLKILPTRTTSRGKHVRQDLGHDGTLYFSSAV